jgi:hypothetical protein
MSATGECCPVLPHEVLTEDQPMCNVISPAVESPVWRAIGNKCRGQEFLARQQGAVSQKQEWIERESQKALIPRKVVSQSAQDAFYARLQKDADQRAARKAEAVSARLAKEAALLKSSKLWRISHKCADCISSIGKFS